MLRASPLAPLCLLAVIVASFVAPATAQAADPVRTAPTTPRTLPSPVAAGGVPSAAGRWIVMLRGDASVDGRRDPRPRHGRRRRSRVQPRRSRLLGEARRPAVRHAPGGSQRGRARARRRDPAPGPVHAARRAPGVRHQEPDREDRRRRRAGGRRRRDRRHRHREDAPRSQRRRRRELLARPTRTRGATGTATGRTSRASSARSTTASAWSASRPGVRLWAVRILNSSGSGLVSWYVCGLDWITAQRDPDDPSRPLIEAVNMSVAKTGLGRPQLRVHQPRPDPPGDLPPRRVRRHGGRGRRQQPLQRVAPGPGELQRGDHGVRAGGQRRQARRRRRQRRATRGAAYDRDDTFANFSNFGRDVDLIAPGKCIWSTLPGTATATSRAPRWRRRTSPARSRCTRRRARWRPRPRSRPRCIAAGNHGWKLSSDPDPYHEPLLDVSHIVNLGDYALVAASAVGRARGLGRLAQGHGRGRPGGGRHGRHEPLRQRGLAAHRHVERPVALGAQRHHVRALDQRARGDAHGALPRDRHRQRRGPRADGARGDRRGHGPPERGQGDARRRPGTRFDTTRFTVRASWPAGTDATTAIGGYQARWQVDGGKWGGTIGLGSTTTAINRTFAAGHRYTLQVRTRDAAGNWSPWTQTGPFTAGIVQDGSSSLVTTHAVAGVAVLPLVARHDPARGRRRGVDRAGVHGSGGRGRRAHRAPSRVGAIYIDGVLVDTLHLHRNHLHPRRVVFTRTWATSANHTITVVVAGTKGHPRVDIDAFVIVR